MSTFDDGDPTADDMDLVERARGGDRAAFGELFTRHRLVAVRLARQMVPASEVDDVVAEAFAKVLKQIVAGKGPQEAFRSYLLTAVRHQAYRNTDSRRRQSPTDDERALDRTVQFGEGQVELFEGEAVRAAYEALPKRWQLVLWHLDVEGRKPAEVAEVLHMRANSVSALAYRARAALRNAYLDQHVKDVVATESLGCQVNRPRLASLVRGTLSTRHRGTAAEHLDDCATCSQVYSELTEVNTRVGALLSPAALVAAAVMVVPRVGGLSGLISRLSAGIQGAAAAQPAAYAAVAATVMAATVAPLAITTYDSAPRPSTSVTVDRAGPAQETLRDRRSPERKESLDQTEVIDVGVIDVGLQTASVVEPAGSATAQPEPGEAARAFYPTVGSAGYTRDYTVTTVGPEETSGDISYLSADEVAALGLPPTDTDTTTVYRTNWMVTTRATFESTEQPTDTTQREYEECGVTQVRGLRVETTIIERILHREGYRRLPSGKTIAVHDVTVLPLDFEIKGVNTDPPVQCEEEDGDVLIGADEEPEVTDELADSAGPDAVEASPETPVDDPAPVTDVPEETEVASSTPAE